VGGWVRGQRTQTQAPCGGAPSFPFLNQPSHVFFTMDPFSTRKKNSSCEIGDSYVFFRKEGHVLKQRSTVQPQTFTEKRLAKLKMTRATATTRDSSSSPIPAAIGCQSLENSIFRVDGNLHALDEPHKPTPGLHPDASIPLNGFRQPPSTRTRRGERFRRRRREPTAGKAVQSCRRRRQPRHKNLPTFRKR